MNKKYNDEHIQFLRENVNGISNSELKTRFNKHFGMNVTENAIVALKSNHGLKSGYYPRGGNSGSFKKGHKSWNKGTKGLVKPNKTSFKKGITPANRRPIGSVRVDVDGYTYVKIKDGHLNRNWELKHVLLWEQHNGPIPKGDNVIFANRDKSDIRIENLILVSDAELLVMNQKGLIFEDSELTKTGANLAKLNRAICDKNVKNC